MIGKGGGGRGPLAALRRPAKSLSFKTLAAKTLSSKTPAAEAARARGPCHHSGRVIKRPAPRSAIWRMQLRTSTEELAAKVPLGKRHRRPGERRDPNRVAPSIRHRRQRLANWRRWLWIPAFAGTTSGFVVTGFDNSDTFQKL